MPGDLFVLVPSKIAFATVILEDSTHLSVIKTTLQSDADIYLQNCHYFTNYVWITTLLCLFDHASHKKEIRLCKFLVVDKHTELIITILIIQRFLHSSKSGQILYL